MGRADELIASGQTDGLARSLVRFCRQVKLVAGHRSGAIQAHSSLKIGPCLIFERLWSNLKIPQVLEEELQNRKYEFSLERAVFISVLHRLFSPSSDRGAEKWKRDHRIEGSDNIELHQHYRAMAWLGDKDVICSAKKLLSLYNSIFIKKLQNTSVEDELDMTLKRPPPKMAGASDQKESHSQYVFQR
ncbi:MAG: hypothetical protein HQ591_07025 [candidate division Zixibacteria bacterium]|nr:hypothetical protein [Candidatus Tariuqbacter arcticus]